MKKDNIYFIALIGIILDQLIKFIVRSHMEVLQTISVIPHFFAITYVQNSGAAWGILGNATILLVLISFVCFYLLLKFIQKEKNMNRLKIIAFGFILSGIIGNLLDRLFYHSVTDYLDFTIFSYHFPVFNLADIMIVVGGILVFIEIVRSEVNER